MQYSLHLQFSHPKGGGTKTSGLTNALNKNAFLSKEKNKICETCNRIHLVHCPMIDLLCKQEKSCNQGTFKNKNISDAATVDKEDEIKIEGNIKIFFLHPLIFQKFCTYIQIQKYLYIYLYICKMIHFLMD